MAEHFWPLWLNALWSTFLIAWSRSESAVTIVAFLPPVSAKRFMVGLAASMRRAVSVPPVRITASTPSCVTSRSPTVPPLQGANCSAVLGTPARQKHWHSR